MLAAALPVGLVVLDSALVVTAVAGGGNCVSECFAGAVVFLFAPTTRPLTAIGYGSAGGDPNVAVVLAVLLLELVLTAGWWLLAGGAITRRAARGRLAWVRWGVLYVVALVAGVYLKVAIHELDGVVGPWVSVPFEAVVLMAIAALMWRWGRLSTDGRRLP